jgi:hypothetical protein
MYILANLVFKLYVPKKLEKGMRFITKQTDIVYGKVYEYLQLHELNHTPQDYDSYISVNGYPVEPYIVPQVQNPDDNVKPLVHPEQIGWFIEGDSIGRQIDIKDINHILQEYNGEVCIEVEDTDSTDTDDMIAFSLDGKVIIRTPDDMPDDEDEEEEDWDDMDDDDYELGGSE